MKLSPRSIELLTITLVSLIISCLSHLPAQTEQLNTNLNHSASEQTKESSEDSKLDFSGDGRPGRRAGGGSRSLCPSTTMPLTALVPANNIGTTVSDRPNFWFYVPYAPQQAAAGEFVLQDKQENDVYRQTFNLPNTPGLVSLKLPQAAPALQVDRSYRWYFKLYCEDSASATANFVEGWISRIPLKPNLETQLKQGKNPAYKEYGIDSIWFDALDSLAQLRLDRDNSQLVREWNELLSAEGVNLNNLTQKPLVGEVTNTSQGNE